MLQLAFETMVFFGDSTEMPSTMMSTVAKLTTHMAKIAEDPVIKRDSPNAATVIRKDSAYFADRQNADKIAKFFNDNGRLVLNSEHAKPLFDADELPQHTEMDWDLIDPRSHLPFLADRHEHEDQGLLQGPARERAIQMAQMAKQGGEAAGRAALFVGPRFSIFLVNKFAVGREWAGNTFDFFQYGFKSFFLKLGKKEGLEYKEFLKPKGYIGFGGGELTWKLSIKLDLCP